LGCDWFGDSYTKYYYDVCLRYIPSGSNWGGTYYCCRDMTEIECIEWELTTLVEHPDFEYNWISNTACQDISEEVNPHHVWDSHDSCP
tara:strand:- start:805 stop:1068 length:264 start_codon:yes stop_codon:yes gene_type:complete